MLEGPHGSGTTPWSTWAKTEIAEQLTRPRTEQYSFLRDIPDWGYRRACAI
jgi:hypothetical protein